jgi:hypothetical protein
LRILAANLLTSIKTPVAIENMLKHCTLVGVFLLFASASFATMTLVSYPTNFFTVIQASSTTTAPTIYAGRTSSSIYCTGPQCDSCTGMASNFNSANGTGTSFTPPASGQYTTCSVKETHAADTMSLTVSSNYSGGVPGAQMYIQSAGGTTSSVTITGVLFNGSSLTFAIPWSDICQAASGDATCSTSFPSTALNIGWGSAGATLTEYVTLQVAFRYVAQSPNYASWCFGTNFSGTYQNDEGFCYFTAYPGDSKAYIFPTAYTAASYVVPDLSDYQGNDASASATDLSAMTYAGVAVFYSTNQTQFTTATPHQTMSFASTTSGTAVGGSLSPKYITGLTNGTPYYMTIASIDQAGILTFFSDPNTSTPTVALGYPMTFTTQVVPPEGNSQAVIPEPVEGLLNGQSCFIATAAYGSVMAPEVETFRQFRGKFLLKSKAGRWFVRTYYKLSPPLADFIAHNDGLRFLARAILLPLLAFVKISLAFGLAPTFFSLILAAFLIWIYLRWGRTPRWTGDER